MLLKRAVEHGAVREGVEVDEVLALLAALSQAALGHDLRERALDLVFTGLSARSR